MGKDILFFVMMWGLDDLGLLNIFRWAFGLGSGINYVFRYKKAIKYPKPIAKKIKKFKYINQLTFILQLITVSKSLFELSLTSTYKVEPYHTLIIPPEL